MQATALHVILQLEHRQQLLHHFFLLLLFRKPRLFYLPDQFLFQWEKKRHLLYQFDLDELNLVKRGRGLIRLD